jgi:dTDP-4-amino-4,6-dideoxygalactose transaminase
VIPIADLRRQYQELRSGIDAAVLGVFESGQFINGPNVRALEEEIAGYVGTKHAIALNSGTDALHLALRALDIGPGDDVITTPFTFVATTEAIGIVGAKPVFVDIDPQTYNLDAKHLRSAITPRTKAILPVHLYGLPAAIDEILAIAHHHGLAVVEDCAQAIGAAFKGRRVGSFGTFGAFSFFPSKNLGAYGDGGMLTTDDDGLARRVRSLRAHGGSVKYHHDELGVNSRLDEVQAAILRVKLPHLDRWIEARRAIARDYTCALGDVVGTCPQDTNDARHVFHQFTLRFEERDRVKTALSKRHIQTMVYYPVPLHLQRVHYDLGIRPGAFPHAERAAAEVLSLPMFPELNEQERTEVASAVRGAVNRAVA